jgi:hypothetical protein
LTPEVITATAYNRKLRSVDDLIKVLQISVKNTDAVAIHHIPEVTPVDGNLSGEGKARAIAEYERLVSQRELAVVRRKLDVAGRDRANEGYKQAFTMALQRYLKRAGHPPDTLGVISQSDFDTGREDPLCRANMMLRGLTESTMLPLKDGHIWVSWCRTFSDS